MMANSTSSRCFQYLVIIHTNYRRRVKDGLQEPARRCRQPNSSSCWHPALGVRYARLFGICQPLRDEVFVASGMYLPHGNYFWLFEKIALVSPRRFRTQEVPYLLYGPHSRLVRNVTVRVLTFEGGSPHSTPATRSRIQLGALPSVFGDPGADGPSLSIPPPSSDNNSSCNHEVPSLGF
jgi:hypothetical protein